MSKVLLEQIKRSINLMGINEADISGIDELVYNPVTGSGGDLGYGYNDGKKVKNITWSGHDDHLHLGFTDKNVAMAVIDKADSLGLRTTENPYAKKDPNKVVDPVHTSTSLHYQTFDGEPKVGKAVDVSGDKGKISELIKWIDSTYAGVSTPTETDDTDTSSAHDSLKELINAKVKEIPVIDILDKQKKDVDDYFNTIASKLYV
jgi:hypothetical protein